MNYLEKFKTLRDSLPRLAVGIVDTQNCDYCNYIDKSKDCYLVVSVFESEMCMYGKFLFFSKWCIDNHYLENCELMYQCLDCRKCYNCDFCQDCENCIDCGHCLYLKGCRNCFGCMNLRQKSYYIFNKPYKKEDYEIKTKELKNLGQKYIEEEFEKLKLSISHPATVGENNENSEGHHIYNNKNIINCYETKHSQDLINCTELFSCTDCTDILIGDYAKWCHECISAYKLENSEFCYNCWESADLTYCEQCYQCRDCLFCANLQHKQYFIFNQPYSREEYFKEKQRIISDMISNGSFGEFIPSTYPIEDSMLNC